MTDVRSQSEPQGDIETALLDAELFVKYGAPERAIKRLRSALERSPRSIPVRERLREVAASHRHSEEAARQCLALASLYIEREDFETAHDRLLEAKQLDQRINIAAGLEAIRRARRPDLQPGAHAADNRTPAPLVTLAGDLSAISVFDAIQVIENARLTGALKLTNPAQEGQLLFNEGAIVDADCAGETGELGFRQIVEITSGIFEFQKSERAFPIKIQASSNTNLILDSLRHLDETSR
jgi:tetratricopeptide (TPR) repeat protein